MDSLRETSTWPRAGATGSARSPCRRAAPTPEAGRAADSKVGRSALWSSIREIPCGCMPRRALTASSGQPTADRTGREWIGHPSAIRREARDRCASARHALCDRRPAVRRADLQEPRPREHLEARSNRPPRPISVSRRSQETGPSCTPAMRRHRFNQSRRGRDMVRERAALLLLVHLRGGRHEPRSGSFLSLDSLCRRGRGFRLSGLRTNSSRAPTGARPGGSATRA